MGLTQAVLLILAALLDLYGHPTADGAFFNFKRANVDVISPVRYAGNIPVQDILLDSIGSNWRCARSRTRPSIPSEVVHAGLVSASFELAAAPRVPAGTIK